MDNKRSITNPEFIVKKLGTDGRSRVKKVDTATSDFDENMQPLNRRGRRLRNKLLRQLAKGDGK
jgi:flagellar biosynthesis/type III secretory pathway chaperone